MRRVALLATLAACGGGGGDPVPFDSFQDSVAALGCDRGVACGFYPDRETCLDAVVRDNDPNLAADVEAGLIAYDADAQRACLDALAELPQCLAIFDDPAYDAVEVACGAVFTGTVAEGGACVRDQQCQGDATCLAAGGCTDEACCAGTCGAPLEPFVDAEIGESCAEASCAFGAYCGEGFVCAAYVALGDPCDDYFACGPGNVCDLDVTTQEGTCVALAARGEPCDPDLFLGGCLDALDVCDGVCTERGDDGDPCDAELETCKSYATCEGGTCVTRPGAGDPCETLGPDCLGDLTCEGAVCELPPPPDLCTL